MNKKVQKRKRKRKNRLVLGEGKAWLIGDRQDKISLVSDPKLGDREVVTLQVSKLPIRKQIKLIAEW